MDVDYDITAYKHDVERFVSDLAKLAVIKGGQSKDNSLLHSRLQAINSICLALSAKTAFLRYLDILSTEKDVAIDIRRHAFVPVIERISYAARHLFYIHHGKIILKPIDLQKEAFCDFKGPDFFEFIPFSIIDNCIKYNLRDAEIKIRAHAAGNMAYADFSSIGPAILDDERELIFSKGYRGRNAVATGKTGQGIGLYHAREATRNAFNGDIQLLPQSNQSSYEVNGIEYGYNTFRIAIPLI